MEFHKTSCPLLNSEDFFFSFRIQIYKKRKGSVREEIFKFTLFTLYFPTVESYKVEFNFLNVVERHEINPIGLNKGEKYKEAKYLFLLD